MSVITNLLIGSSRNKNNNLSFKVSSDELKMKLVTSGEGKLADI